MGAYGITGDPAGMRALAALLRSQAGITVQGSTRVDRGLDAIDYQGLAATRVKGDLGLWQFENAGMRSEYEHTAALLEHEAARVQALQEEARREAERRERQEHLELARRR